jgi:hypothetical protein
MQVTKSLFSVEEAFARLGQSRETGCLVIVSEKETFRIFTRDACVVNAYGEGTEGLAVLKACFADIDAGYVWLPNAKPAKAPMNINIVSHSLEIAIAKDIHLSKTARVKLGQAARSSAPIPKKTARYFLTAKDKPGEKMILDKATMIIGRDNSCDIIIAVSQISRRHCLLQSVVRGLAFRDVESANGIRVNGVPAKEGFIHPGDKLMLGDYELTVHRETK